MVWDHVAKRDIRNKAISTTLALLSLLFGIFQCAHACSPSWRILYRVTVSYNGPFWLPRKTKEKDLRDATRTFHFMTSLFGAEIRVVSDCLSPLREISKPTNSGANQHTTAVSLELRWHKGIFRVESPTFFERENWSRAKKDVSVCLLWLKRKKLIKSKNSSDMFDDTTNIIYIT